MRPFHSITCCIALLIPSFLGVTATGASRVEFAHGAEQVDVYDFVEVAIRVPQPDAANPFTDVSVQGTFTLEGAEPVHVDGFCDSMDGSVYRIRFMPSRAGQYRYEVIYKQENRQSKHQGSFKAIDAGRKGPLRLDPQNRLHFIWEGTGGQRVEGVPPSNRGQDARDTGTYEHYFWNGTTTYYLMGWDDETIRTSIDRLHRLKINRLRVLVYGRNEPRPWGWPAQRPDDIKNPGFDLTRFNVEHWQKYERLLRYAREKDMIISVILYIGGQVLPTPFEADSEQERLYYRYAVARLAAFSNVTWDLGNEYNFHRKAPEWADKMGHQVKEWDPYDHLTSAHNVTHRTPQSTWLDMQLIQRWDSGQNAFMLSQREAQEQTGYIIPQINEEYGYEDLWEKYPGQRAAETRRKNAWEICMAGCYQTTGESARQGTGVPPDTGGGWVNGRGDDSMTMLVGFGYMVDFFTAFDWWNYQPYNEAVDGPACCLAKPGQVYIVYFREGGRATVKLTDDRYKGTWFNPRMGQWAGTCTASGPAWTTPATADSEDWILRLEKDNAAKDDTPPEVISVVVGGNGQKVLVEFDELPDATTATDARHYGIDPGVTIQKVSLEGPYGKTAALSVSALKEDRTYTLRVTGIRDRAGNEMEPAELSFEYIPAGRPLVELRFNDGQGRIAVNSGVSRKQVAQAQLTSDRPAWSSNTPPGGGSHSVDFSGKAGEYAIDLARESAQALEGLKSFTITAWINCVSNDEGPGGNRIVHMADTMGSRAGIDLVVTRDGRVKLGVNEWPDNTQAASSPGLVPVDSNAGQGNWRFVAVTYDATASGNHVKFYVGSPTSEARLDKAISYERGPAGKGTGVLTIGHFNPGTRGGNGNRMFRGLIDEVRLFGSKTDGAGALAVEQIRSLQRNDDR